MSVSWTTTYGLAWVADIPNPGTKVEHSGEWQQCALGYSYDLDESGGWVARQKTPYADANSVNVGSNGYHSAVHIIVGVQDPVTQKWTPIWLGTNALLINGHGEYTPQQGVKLWYNAGTLTGTMISSQSTNVQEYNMSKTPKYYLYFLTQEGDWAIPQPDPFIPDGSLVD